MFYFLSFFDGKKSCSTYYYINETNKTSKNDIDFLAVLILFFILCLEKKKKENESWHEL